MATPSSLNAPLGRARPPEAVLVRFPLPEKFKKSQSARIRSNTGTRQCMVVGTHRLHPQLVPRRRLPRNRSQLPGTAVSATTRRTTMGTQKQTYWLSAVRIAVSAVGMPATVYAPRGSAQTARCLHLCRLLGSQATSASTLLQPGHPMYEPAHNKVRNACADGHRQCYAKSVLSILELVQHAYTSVPS